MQTGPLLVLPSDHYIKNEKKFITLIKNTTKINIKDKLICFGIKPTSPETKYGYIIRDDKTLKYSTLSKIKSFKEKPSLNKAPSNYAVIGRYILPTKIFSILKKQRPGKNGEIHITDSIRFLIKNRYNFLGHVFDGMYLDCGTMQGYINSFIKISKL